MKNLASLLVLTIIFFPSVDASIIYTDVTPDLVTIPSGSAGFDVDMDNDNNPDFRFTCVDVSGLQFIIVQTGQIGTGNFVLIDTSGSNYFAKALTTNSPITPSSTVWHSMASTNPSLFTSFASQVSGLWINGNDYFLGVKFLISSNYHYGWIRMQIDPLTAVVTLRDYAYEDQANTTISAGALPGADVATNIILTDTAENSNSSDFQISFDRAVNENTVDEYRVILVKNSVSGFDVTSAQSMTASQYQSIIPAGSNVTTSLSNGLLDSDGNPIKLGTMYKAFVHSVADTAVIAADGLSNPSGPEELNTTTLPALDITCYDFSNHGNASDINLELLKASSEFGIQSYRIFVVKSSMSASFDLATAENIMAGKYEDVSPTGSNLQLRLSSSLADSDGDPVQKGVAYKLFAMSLADGTDANKNSVSQTSNEITLSDTALGLSGQINPRSYFKSQGNQILIYIHETSSNYQFQLLDMNGRLVLTRQFSQGIHRLNLNETKGTFVGVLTSNSNRIQKKMVLGY